MWSRMAKMPTFTTSCLCCLLCPTPCYSALLLPTSYHFSPHPTRFSSVVKRNRANVVKKVVGICVECAKVQTHIFHPTACGSLARNLQLLVVDFRLPPGYSRGTPKAGRLSTAKRSSHRASAHGMSSSRTRSIPPACRDNSLLRTRQ